jgi:pyruvate dehydrogenase E2 component (dihydrolipoamide acetyltransferase)
MANEYKMPQLGLTMTEGRVAKWHKKVGDTVAMGDILIEVETDKITNEIEAPFEGVILDILVKDGETAPVQAPLALIGQTGEKIVAASPARPAAATAPANANGGWIKASPLARRLAGEKGLDLSLIAGTGPHGRVVERDVLAFALRSQPNPAPQATRTAAEHGVDQAALAKDLRITGAGVSAALPKAVVPASEGTPITGARRVISERMSASWRTAPHVTLTVEVDMTEAGKWKSRLTAITGTKFSFTEIITKCVAVALTEFKNVNASLIDGKIYYHDAANIGVAVAVDDGLIVPVIKNADQKSVPALHDEIRILSGKARQGQLSPDEVTGGTFTVTNLGMFGVDEFTPIINQPESAILGVCRSVDRPVAKDGAVAIRPMMNLCLSFDHRLIDGAVAARFMARVRQLLEEPLLLV